MAGSHILTSNPNSLLVRKPPSTLSRALRKTAALVSAAAKRTENHEVHMEHNKDTSNLKHVVSRREAIAIGLVSFAVASKIGDAAVARAEDNGLWLTGPLPVPSVSNKELANKETGTRSFVQNGIYMANIGADGSAYRLRQYAFDLTTLGDLMGQDAWSYMRRYLRLKSTVMYFDFDKVISAAPIDQKQVLTDLANRLFNNFEKLEDAIKMRNDPVIESCLAETTPILQEVMIKMA